MNKLLLTFLFFLVVSFTSQAQENSLNLKEEIIFGLDKELDGSELLGQVNGFVVDDNFNLYVIDSMTQEIKVFDKNGKLINRIGKRGRGPGEFLRLNNLYLESDLIYAFDPVQYRVTIFDTKGDLVSTISTPKESQVANFFRQIVSYDEKNFLIFYKQWGEGNYSKYDKDEIFHIWDRKFKSKKNSFGSFERFNFKNSFGEIVSRSRGGSMLFIDEEIIYVSPYLYDGFLYKYIKSNNKWSFNQKISGTKLEVEAYIEAKDINEKELSTFRSFGKTVQGKYSVIDAGIYSYMKDFIVHFILFKRYDLNDVGQKWEFGAELFNKKGEFISYSTLSIVDGIDVNHSERIIDYKDNDGSFYMLFGKQGEHLIKRFKLEISK
ncbi:MAG: 6-bladed beta-propeller [Balneola sp.]